MAFTISRQVSQTSGETSVYYWGEGGLYGPYDIQQEGAWAGWPNFGQVLHDFRKKANLSAKAFGELYGKTVNDDKKPISGRRIYNMELKNDVPVDIDRRKIITELLGIPPMLFGIAVLEDITIGKRQEQPSPVIGGQTIIKRATTDIDRYEADLRTRWQLHAFGNPQDALPAIDADISQLEQLTTDAKGDFLARVQELLFSNYLLASRLVEWKRRYSDAYSYANNAVRVAEALDDPDLVATALERRGLNRLYMGLYGTFNEQGLFIASRPLLKDAVRDFEEAQKKAHPQLRGLAMLESGRAQAHLDVNYDPLDTLNKAARLIGKDHISDPYLRQTITGGYSGFHEGAYLAYGAALLNEAGDPIEALSNIEVFKKLSKNPYHKQQRTSAWIDRITAESYLRMRDYDQATLLARQALEVYLDIRDIGNVVVIRDLYGRLLSTSYGTSRQVQELGKMLKQGKTLQKG